MADKRSASAVVVMTSGAAIVIGAAINAIAENGTTRAKMIAREIDLESVIFNTSLVVC
jgi:hypothetical protein|nr:MAG TPA: hypothetical protein [Caudoviricetes sp.]